LSKTCSAVPEFQILTKYQGRDQHEAITVPFTFVATAWAISYVGARPIFVDIEPQACNLDAEKLARAIRPQTRAVVPVHLYGQMADLEPIRELCEKNGLALIEDAAQAHGGEYKGQRAGTVISVALVFIRRRIWELMARVVRLRRMMKKLLSGFVTCAIMRRPASTGTKSLVQLSDG
jgi:DegT/DnrJ/EryC1/StrS aminotransferase family